MSSPFSPPQAGQGHSRQPAVARDVVPATITFAALGLDISQAEVTVCLLLPDGRELVPRWTIPNSLPGAECLAKQVQSLAKAEAHQRGAHRAGSHGTLLVASSVLSARDPFAH